jgi:required for meiotic nuclear division protein 1
MSLAVNMSVEAKHITAHALYVGARIDVRQLESGDTLATSPLTIRAGEKGYIVIFRFGIVVFFNLTPLEEAEALRAILLLTLNPFSESERDSMEIVVAAQEGDVVDTHSRVHVVELTIDRVQVLAEVLAKSAVLSHYEKRVAAVFDRVERMADQLGRGVMTSNGKDLLKEIGGVLLIQAQTVGRADVLEKPEIIWDSSALDRLYEKLVVEYELRERDRALSRKLSVIAHTAETYLELEHNRQSRRLEWYIVMLIVIEIILSLF